MKNKKRHAYFTSNTAIMLLILIIIALLLVPLLTFYHFRMEAHHALREAKNVQLSMRLVSLEYYGQGGTIADTKNPSGLRTDKEAEILDLAEAEGEIYVKVWDEQRMMPERFVFHTGNYIVDYVRQGENKESWSVSRKVQVLSYP